MDANTVQQVVRIVMQIVAGALMSKGYLDQEMAATLTGAVVSLAGVAWWAVWNKKTIKK